MNETKVNTNIGDVPSVEAKKNVLRPYWYRPEVGPQPPLILISTNIGLGGRVLYALLQDHDGIQYECHIQAALRLIDLVQEPGRVKVLAGAELEYGLPVGAMMGPVCELSSEGSAR